MSPNTQGPDLTPPSPSQIAVDSGSVSPPPQSLEDKQVQKEPSSKEQPEKMVTNEVLKEGQMVEYSQPPSQDTKVQATGSTETEAIEGESSQ